MPSLTNNLYRFGEFSLDAQARVLRRGSEAVPLTPKAFDVLLLLIQNVGKTGSKDELMQAVWPGSFVEESNLTQTIFMVRKALNETTDRRYILTVQSKGYQFLVPVIEAPVTEATSVEPGDRSKTEAPVVPPPADGREIQLQSHVRSLRGWRSAVLALAAVALILIAGFTLWPKRPQKQPAEQPGRIM